MSEQIALLNFLNDFLHTKLGYFPNMHVNPINPSSYQNNKSWAIANKSKGFIASCFSIGSTVSGVTKACSSKDSKVYKISNFFEKVFYAVSNCLQYFLFGRKDDVVGDDEEKRPIAAKIGKVATFQEKYINPIVKPASVLLNANQQEGLNDALNFLDSFYWKVRFALEKIQWEKLRLIPVNIKQLLDSKVNVLDKDKTTKIIGEILAPICGWVGTVCIGIFNPIKACLKFFDRENKIINCLAYVGKAAINIPYFFKFTLPMFWKGLATQDKKFHGAFVVGTASNVMNVALPVIELLPKENSFINKFLEVYKSLTSNLSMVFFPLRRNCLGDDWLKRNEQNDLLTL